MKLAFGIIVGLILGALVFSGGTAFVVINKVVPAVQKAFDNSNEKQPAKTTSLPTTTKPSSTTNPNQTSVSPIATTTIPLQSNDLSSGNFQISDGKISLQVSIVSVEGTGFTRTVTGKVTNNGSVVLHNSELKVELFSNNKQLNINGQPTWQKSYGTLAAGTSLTDKITLSLSLLDGLSAAQYGIEIHMTFLSTEKSQTVIYQYTLN